jgi:hypothetical protein
VGAVIVYTFADDKSCLGLYYLIYVGLKVGHWWRGRKKLHQIDTAMYLWFSISALFLHALPVDTGAW